MLFQFHEPTPYLFSIYLEVVRNCQLICKNPGKKRWLIINFWDIWWFFSKANFNILAVWREGISGICYYKCWSFLYSKLSSPDCYFFISFQFHRRFRKRSGSLFIHFFLPVYSHHEVVVFISYSYSADHMFASKQLLSYGIKMQS